MPGESSVQLLSFRNYYVVTETRFRYTNYNFIFGYLLVPGTWMGTSQACSQSSCYSYDMTHHGSMRCSQNSEEDGAQSQAWSHPSPAQTTLVSVWAGTRGNMSYSSHLCNISTQHRGWNLKLNICALKKSIDKIKMNRCIS